MKNCNECKWISITEEQQRYINVPHICVKHNCRVYHWSITIDVRKDRIYPCKECNGKDFEQMTYFQEIETEKEE